MLNSSLDFAKKPEKYFIKLNKNIHLNNINCDINLLKKAYYFSFDPFLLDRPGGFEGGSSPPLSESDSDLEEWIAEQEDLIKQGHYEEC